MAPTSPSPFSSQPALSTLWSPPLTSTGSPKPDPYFLVCCPYPDKKKVCIFFLDGSSKFFSFTNGMLRNLDFGPLGYLICDTYLTGFKYQSTAKKQTQKTRVPLRPIFFFQLQKHQFLKVPTNGSSQIPNMNNKRNMIIKTMKNVIEIPKH